MWEWKLYGPTNSPLGFKRAESALAEKTVTHLDRDTQLALRYCRAPISCRQQNTLTSLSWETVYCWEDYGIARLEWLWRRLIRLLAAWRLLFAVRVWARLRRSAWAMVSKEGSWSTGRGEGVSGWEGFNSGQCTIKQILDWFLDPDFIS